MPVSVIIPAFNAAATLAETLRSVGAQTNGAWEAVVVDDGSRDGTGDIAREFAAADARVRVIAQANGGEAAARNRGIAAAQHEWLLFLDADDWIDPRHLERLTAQLTADPALDAVHCGYARVATDGTHIVDTYRPPTGDLFPILARRAAFPVHACVVRRALVDDVGRFDPAFQTSADWDLWQRVARTGANFGSVPDVLAFYRMSPQGRSLEATQLFRDGFRILSQGQSADARVRRPRREHAQGGPDAVHTQQFYLLTWCAGLLLGQERDPYELFAHATAGPFPALYPPAIAHILFDAVPLPHCQPPRAWGTLWTPYEAAIKIFLADLERHAAAPGLAKGAIEALKPMVRAAIDAAPGKRGPS